MENHIINRRVEQPFYAAAIKALGGLFLWVPRGQFSKNSMKKNIMKNLWKGNFLT